MESSRASFFVRSVQQLNPSPRISAMTTKTTVSNYPPTPGLLDNTQITQVSQSRYIAHIAVPCRNLDETARWYSQVLGAQPVRILDDRVTFSFGGVLQLLHAGVLARQRAILLGDFSGYRLGDNDNGYDFDRMLAQARRAFGLPILTGLPFGHVHDKLTLPVGAHCHVQSQRGGYRLYLGGYPTLA